MKLFIPFITGNRKQPALLPHMMIKITNLPKQRRKKHRSEVEITPAVKTYTGFDSPKTQTKAVTADGKMVIDYYYERHLYNVTLNAGTGIEKTIGAGPYRYGQSVTIDANVKEGYHWLNWKGNYKGGSGGEQTVDAKKFVFTMPAGNVTMTANQKANKYTIHFDPNGGAGHIDDIETTYDTDVTLPDVWNADGTAAYVKYTLDGQNVTEDVIAGVIPKAMMDGYEEEETEDMEDTEDPDNAEDPEGAGNSEDEDSENNGDDSDAGNSDADAQNSMNAVEEAGNAETADNSDESDEAETADNSDESDDTDNPNVTDNTDQNEKVAVTKENKDDAEDIDALNDLEEEDIEENKKAEEPKKKSLRIRIYGLVLRRWQRHLYPAVESRRCRSEPCGRRWWRDHTLCCLGRLPVDSGTGSLLYLRAGTEWFYHGRRNLKPCNGNRPGRWKSDFTGNQSGTE